jgi:hypothetical protein
LSKKLAWSISLLVHGVLLGLLPAMAQTCYALDTLGGPQHTVPEPSSLLLLGAGLMYAAASIRARVKR